MARHHTTERLILRPWAPADAELYRALVVERGGSTPRIEEIEMRITTQLADLEQTGIGLLPIVRQAEGTSSGTAV